MILTKDDYQKILEISNKSTINEGNGISHLNGFILACQDLGLGYKKTGRFLKIYHPYYSNRILGGVADMVPSPVTSMAIKMANDKNAMYQTLNDAGIKTVGQKKFLKSEFEEAFKFFSDNNHYSVMKPSNNAGGRGVIVGVLEETFKESWDLCWENIKSAGVLLLEERARGFDIRAIMIGDNFSCAVSRVPPYVIGDGVSTVEKLILEKNKQRLKHPHHKRFPIDVNMVKNSSYILKKEEVFFLSNISNIHQGGEAIDVTDYITNELKNYLVKIMRAIPGLNVAGIDIFIKDFDDINSLRVIEINTSPNYEIHYTPYRGVKRDPAKSFISFLMKDL